GRDSSKISTDVWGGDREVASIFRVSAPATTGGLPSKCTLATTVHVVTLAMSSSEHEFAASPASTAGSQAIDPAVWLKPALHIWAEDEPDWTVEMTAWDERPVIGRDTSLIVPGLPTDPDPDGPVTDLRVEVWGKGVEVWDVALPEMGPDDRGHVAILEPW